jgi:hypothetical protein
MTSFEKLGYLETSYNSKNPAMIIEQDTDFAHTKCVA